MKVLIVFALVMMLCAGCTGNQTQSEKGRPFPGEVFIVSEAVRVEVKSVKRNEEGFVMLMPGTRFKVHVVEEKNEIGTKTKTVCALQHHDSMLFAR